MMTDNQRTDSTKFLAALTLALLAASLWIFSSFLNYLLVGAVLALVLGCLTYVAALAFERKRRAN